jgi:lipopolysaccharide export system protein LptA
MMAASDAGAQKSVQGVPNAMQGRVVLTKCKTVLRGDRLLVDMTTGASRIESDSGKVQGLFPQGDDCGSPIPGAPPPGVSNKPK